jgi:hypothetical protein
VLASGGASSLSHGRIRDRSAQRCGKRRSRYFIAERQSPASHVRARAVDAWGRHSDPGEFEVADLFWNRSQRRWRTYAVVAIQSKEVDERDRRWEAWSGEGRSLQRLARELRDHPIRWSRL